MLKTKPGGLKPIWSDTAPLALLAPDIVEAICVGQQPPDLTLETLVYADLPRDWIDQRRVFGFKAI